MDMAGGGGTAAAGAAAAGGETAAGGGNMAGDAAAGGGAAVSGGGGVDYGEADRLLAELQATHLPARKVACICGAVRAVSSADACADVCRKQAPLAGPVSVPTARLAEDGRSLGLPWA